VDNLGNDLTGNGEKNSPYASIKKCLDNLSTSTPLVYIGKGIYTTSHLTDLSLSNKTITFIGSDIETIIEIVNGSGSGKSWLSPVNFYNCIMRPSNNFNGDLRFISYSNDNFSINFFNVVFTKSINNQYPTQNYYALHGNSGSFKSNKCWYNCTFTDTINPFHPNGVATLNNCAIQNKISNGILNNSILNCLFDISYNILNENGAISIQNEINGVYSGDSAWIKILIKMNGSYYSILDNLYDLTLQSYTPLSNPSFEFAFNRNKLFNEITIEGETFKPIDKFNNFSIVNKNIDEMFLQGIKSSSELVVQAFDVNFTLMSKVNFIDYLYTEPIESSVKLVLSRDMGDTWETINDLGNLIYTDCIIPKKSYKKMNTFELSQFIAAKETIRSVGFTISSMKNLNFNLVNIELLRFAFVLSTDSYLNNPSINSLKINFDEKGYLKELEDSECDIEVFDHSVKVTSHIESPMIQTSIVI